MELARFFGFLHPALVHFPLVLLLVSVLLEALGFLRRDSRFAWAAQILLLLGTTGTLFAFVAGNFAEVWAARDGIPQDPMEFHELLATITSWTFVFLTAARLFLGVGKKRGWMAAYLVAASLACGLLVYTGHKGAMLVYNHGAGVHAAGIQPLATHEDMAVLLQKQEPDALFYSNKMHHVFGVMVMILALMLLTDQISPKWGDRLRRFAPLLLLSGGVFLMIFSDQDAWPLYQVRPFRPWSDKEVLMHKTYAILMLAAGFNGLRMWWKARREKKKRRKGEEESRETEFPSTLNHQPSTQQLHARMMAIFALVGGGLLFTHVHSNAPYANVAAGVYIHHTVMGVLALCIGAVKLVEDALIQQKREQADTQKEQLEARSTPAEIMPEPNSSFTRQNSSRIPHPSSLSSSSTLPLVLAWVYPILMLIESVFLINYNEGLPWFLGYGNLALSAPHGGLIAPLGKDRAEFVYNPATQKIDVYVLNQGDDRDHMIGEDSAVALVKVGTDTTAVNLTAEPSVKGSSRFTGYASFLRNVPLFQMQMLVIPKGQGVNAAPLVADFEPWIDRALTLPHSNAKYICPMHDSQGANVPGICPLCKMALVPNKPPRPANMLHDPVYRMDSALTMMKVAGPQPQEGQVNRLFLTLRRSDGLPVTSLDVVHTKRLHLIIVSPDLSFFDHVHPELQSDGSLMLDYVFPHGGEYILYADCTPTGDRNQVFRIPITVWGESPTPQPLLATPAQARTFGAYRVALTLTPNPPQANDETQLTFTLSKDGLPLTDVQPFLGAGGHCVIVSEDTQNYLHSHPMEMGGTRFGPNIVFHAKFPHAGKYKIWGQFQHEGQPLTADFIVQVP